MLRQRRPLAAPGLLLHQEGARDQFRVKSNINPDYVRCRCKRCWRLRLCT